MRLSRLRRRAAWGIWTERLAGALAPSCGILAAYLAASLFGLGSPPAFIAVLVLAAAALLRGLLRLRRPGPAEIDRRIEQASGLRHRPIAMLEDAPENDTEMALAIWRLHQRRAVLSLRTARAGRPMVQAAQHDPFALRGLLLLLLLVGAITAGPAGLARIAGAFALPAWPFAGPSVTAWITQPAFTGVPPLVLEPGDHPTAIAGSRLTLVVSGARLHASLGGDALPLTGSAQEGYRADVVLRHSGRLRIGPWWHRLAAWDVTVLPPARPQLTMQQPVAEGHRLFIRWHGRDRYGLVSLGATLLPEGYPRALPERLRLPFYDQNPKDAGGVAKPDVADSPYAGLEVGVTLTARNLAGVFGSAGPMTVRLPAADLQDPTARALAGLRQSLALQPDRADGTAKALHKLAEAPPSHISASADLQMAVLAGQLRNHEISAADAEHRLGMLARQVEEGPDYEPAQALAAADRALDQALRQGLSQGKPVESARLQSLLAAMHSALARHLQALGPSAAKADGKTVTTGDLDRLAEQIARDEAAGRTARAAAELAHLEKMLAALQSARPMSAEQAKRAQAADQAAQALSRMTQGESALLDQTNKGGGVPGTQGALQNQLAATRQGLAKAHMALPGLADAASAMAEAHGALADKRTGDAIAAEGEAIQGLQKAQAALAAASQGMSFGAGATPSDNDYGYGEGLYGAPDEDSIPGILPSGESPAQQIQRQIIHNDDNPALPGRVHQYYHRLLDQDTP